MKRQMANGPFCHFLPFFHQRGNPIGQVCMPTSVPFGKPILSSRNFQDHKFSCLMALRKPRHSQHTCDLERKECCIDECKLHYHSGNAFEMTPRTEDERETKRRDNFSINETHTPNKNNNGRKDHLPRPWGK